MRSTGFVVACKVPQRPQMFHSVLRGANVLTPDVRGAERFATREDAERAAEWRAAFSSPQWLYVAIRAPEADAA